MRRLKIFTWHVHGSYLYYLSQLGHDFYIPFKPGRPARYYGRTSAYQWPENIHEIPAHDVANTQFDCVLFQHRENFLADQYEDLSDAQRESLPLIYLEHDPPRESPTETMHFAAGSRALIVHVTHFNALMWNNGGNTVQVVEHGVIAPPHPLYSGELERGIVIINNLLSRGRRLGLDIYQKTGSSIALDLVGINSSALAGGLGEIPHAELMRFASRYRFFFHPVRYTSLGLALLEAMAAGIPVVGLATTELPALIKSGLNGFISTDLNELIECMRELLNNRAMAHKLGEAGRRLTIERFSIGRFIKDWSELFENTVLNNQFHRRVMRSRSSEVYV